MNIAEILKYCPKGTKLYSLVNGEVLLNKVNTNDPYPIEVFTEYGSITKFTEDGLYLINASNGECVLFPSKDQRDWSKFRLPLKRGDIMMKADGTIPFIASGEFYKDVSPKYICGVDTTGRFSTGAYGWTSEFYILASEEAKKELFTKMAEVGYKWNANTLELEKIESKFKEGDVVIDNQGNLCLVSKIRDDGFIIIAAALYTNNVLNIFTGKTVLQSIQLVSTVSTTDRNKLYSALVREGYKYDKEGRKLIKQKFKPFDKVLARDTEDEPWKADIYLDYDEGSSFPYICTGDAHNICISYEGNEYLLGTTNNN